jgi:eukaryotic translation initiation factor 2C
MGGGGKGGQQYSSAGRRGRGGRARGGGRGGAGRESPAYDAPPMESDFPSLSSSAPSVSALNRQVERKLNIQCSASTSATPQPSSSSAQPEVQSAVQQPVQKQPSASTSATPQASRSSAQPEVQSAVQQPVQKQLPPASSKAIRIPARPGFGTVGRKCKVRANHFLVEVATKDIHHYDVSCIFCPQCVFGSYLILYSRI